MKWPLVTLFGLPLLVLVSSQSNVTEADYRLPKDINAIDYRILVTPDPDRSTFTASVTFTFTVLTDFLECVVLNSHGLTYDYPSLRLRESITKASVPLGRLELQEDIQRVVLYPSQRLNAGYTYIFTASYSGIIYDDGTGVYRTQYKDSNGFDRWMVVTQLRPVYARRLFPCLDEPAFKATFQLQVRHDPLDYVLSNTDVVSTKSSSDKVITTFQRTPVMSTFLVAFLVSQMARVPNGQFSGYSVPGKERGIVYSTQVGPAMADEMERHINIRYPLNKTDQVALPFLVPVAMENWALFNFRENNILYFPDEDKTVQKQTAARYSGHEICHAWMGNAVSLRWWDYLWLSEAFAMYYEYFLPGRVEPSWRMMEQMVVDLTQFGLDLDAMSSTPPLTTKLLTPAQISAKFMGITYFKGPSLIRMVINFINEEPYIRGFRQMLLDNWMGNVEPKNLWDSLEGATDQVLPNRLANIMSTWTDVSGYPVVTVSRDITTDTLYLQQERFLLDNSEASYNGSVQWWIPISFTTKGELNFENTLPKVWFPPQVGLRTDNYVPHDYWYILNIQATGFFRVNYDDENWRNLISELVSFPTNIHVLNRAALIDDSLALARSSRMLYSTTFDLIRYLANEYDYIPWATALRESGLTYVNKMLHESTLHDGFKKYMLAILENVYNHVGFEERPGDSHLDKLLRELIVRWACSMGNRDCIRKSRAYVQALSNGFAPQISPDVMDTALCTAVAEGDQKPWLTVLSLYRRADDINRNRYFAALGCARNPGIISDYLEKSISELSVDEWTRRYNSFAARAENADLLLDMIFRNVRQIDNRFGSSSLISFVNTISKHLQTSEQYQKISSIENYGILLTDALTTVLSRINWLANHSSEFYTYLQTPTSFTE